MADGIDLHFSEEECSPDQGCYDFGRTVQDRTTAFEMVLSQGFFGSLISSSYLTQFAIFFVLVSAIAITVWIVRTTIFPGFRQKVEDLWGKIPGYVVDDVDYGRFC